MSKNRTSEVKKIQAILKDNTHNMTDKNVYHYDTSEKFDAIFNWQKNSYPDFDLTFVESVHDTFKRRGAISGKQTGVLNTIIEKFKIDMDKWV